MRRLGQQGPRPRKGWFGADDRLRAAQGNLSQFGQHFAAGQLSNAAEKLKFRTMPVFEPDEAFTIEGDSDAAVDFVRPLLLDRYDTVWSEHDLCSMFQMQVVMLFYYRSSYSYVQFSERTDKQPAVLELFAPLAPETLCPVSRKGDRAIEQYVRAEVAGKDTFFEFDTTELLALEWPLASPPGPTPPLQAATRIGAREDLFMDRSILPMRAQNEESETFITFAQARLGKYATSFFRRQADRSAGQRPRLRRGQRADDAVLRG